MMLFSRMVVFKNRFPSVMAITAMGMDAETVRPALRARYTVAAPKIMPKSAPVRMDFRVNSAIFVSAGTKGRNSFCISAIAGGLVLANVGNNLLRGCYGILY